MINVRGKSAKNRRTSRILFPTLVDTHKLLIYMRVRAELLNALLEYGLYWLHDITMDVWNRGSIPDYRRKSEMVPIYTYIRYVIKGASYRGTMLMEHAKKVLERVMNTRLIREIVDFGGKQCVQ